MRPSSLAAGATLAGVCLAFYFLSNATEHLLVAPILAAAICAGVLTLTVYHSESLSDIQITRSGLLLAATFFAINAYEVLLYSLRFCSVGRDGYTSFPLSGPRQSYCALIGDMGYWLAFVPTVAVLLASTIALRRGPRPLAVASIGALVWSLIFLFVPVVLPASS